MEEAYKKIVDKLLPNLTIETPQLKTDLNLVENDQMALPCGENTDAIIEKVKALCEIQEEDQD